MNNFIEVITSYLCCGRREKLKVNNPSERAHHPTPYSRLWKNNRSK